MLQVVNPDIQKLAHRTLDTKDPKNTVYIQVMHIIRTLHLHHKLVMGLFVGF